MPNAQYLLLLFSELFYFVAVLYLIDKDFRWLEAWNVVLFNDDGRITRNVARDFFLSLFIDETSETANINVMPAGHRVFYNGKEGFYRRGYIRLVDASLFCNLINNVCFRHGAGVLLLRVCLELGKAKLIFAARIKNNIEKF